MKGNNTSVSNSIKVPYSIWWNEKQFDVDPDIFERLSKKFSRIRKTNPSMIEIQRVMDEETFKSFLAACQLKHFDVSKQKAFDLLDFAIEWEVPSLEAFVSGFIEQNKLERPKNMDYLGILLEKVDKDEDSRSDWVLVANDINKALVDDRFSLLPPEVIYQILSLAENKGIEQRLLVDFVIALLKSKPNNAVPLILRIDFGELTPEEKDFIFNNPKVHEMNANFFLASSVSAISKKTENELLKAERKHQIELDVHRSSNEKLRQQAINENNEAFTKDINDLISQSIAFQKQIDNMTKEIDIHEGRVETVESKIVEQRTPLDEVTINNFKNSLSKELTKLTDEVNRQLNKYQKTMDSICSKSGPEATEFFKNTARKSDREHDRARITLQDLVSVNKTVIQSVAEMETQMQEIKAILCAKVINDRLRFDNYLRRTTKKYKLFDNEPRIWGLTSEIVMEAEKKLKDVENKLDVLCPTRMNASVTPTSKK